MRLHHNPDVDADLSALFLALDAQPGDDVPEFPVDEEEPDAAATGWWGETIEVDARLGWD